MRGCENPIKVRTAGLIIEHVNWEAFAGLSETNPVIQGDGRGVVMLGVERELPSSCGAR